MFLQRAWDRNGQAVEWLTEHTAKTEERREAEAGTWRVLEQEQIPTPRVGRHHRSVGGRKGSCKCGAARIPDFVPHVAGLMGQRNSVADVKLSRHVANA